MSGMIVAYLYNTQDNELTILDGDELMSSAPDGADAANKKGAPRTGQAHRGRPQCHTNEMMWVDITNPDADDFKLLKQRFALHPMVIEDIKAKEGRPKLHTYSEYLYLIFHSLQLSSTGVIKEDTPEPHHEGGLELQVSEIDCLVGPDYVVTLHSVPLKPLDDLRDRWLRNPELMRAGTGYLLYEIMDEVLDDYFPLLDVFDERIDEFEDRLFSGGEAQLSSDIFSMKRSLLQVRRIAGPTRDVVNTLLRHDADSGGQNFAYYQDLYDHAVRIVDMIDTFREILSGALDAYLAIQSNRMNEVMKTLTSASIILLVPTLIAGIYGMNFNPEKSPLNMPELNSPYGYPVALGVMAATIIGLYAYFKRKEWL